MGYGRKSALPTWKYTSWTKYAAPREFYVLTGSVVPYAGALAAVLAVAGAYIGFFRAPGDFQQGQVYRIIFLHVPAAWMSLFLYLVMAFWAVVGLIFHTRLAAMMARSVAPTGAMFTLLALVTGAIWGKPTWGTWWVWDARLTSELILLLLYVGIVGLGQAIDDPRRADRACALLAIVGAINVPIIYFSVKWWNTLHQGASIKMDGNHTMTLTMIQGICLMSAAFWSYAIAVASARVRCVLREREHASGWMIKHQLLRTKP